MTILCLLHNSNDLLVVLPNFFFPVETMEQWKGYKIKEMVSAENIRK